ncbi:hypothetical protein [Tsukamurella sp. 1534]|uniref:hypothetical protein n=1 Tax=Tsukamurella sp. 1534 TaxID=1151061 RepID=UPI000310B64D|nr:hypothetical protein [Tsukamurella sp. 1534]
MPNPQRNPTLTQDELDRAGLTVDVPTAGRAFGLGKSQSYVYAEQGKFPFRVHQIGHRKAVATADLRAALGLSR